MGDADVAVPAVVTCRAVVGTVAAAPVVGTGGGGGGAGILEATTDVLLVDGVDGGFGGWVGDPVTCRLLTGVVAA